MNSTPSPEKNTLVKLGNNISYREQLVPGGIPNGLLVVDHQWTVTAWNAAAGELLGIRQWISLAETCGRYLQK